MYWPTAKINYCWKLYSSIFCSQSLLLEYHNCKPQGISNQYYPVLDNVQDFTFEIFSEFLWATMVVLCSLWATRTLLFKGWAIKISKINNFFATYSPEQPHKIITIIEWASKVFQKDEQSLCYLFSWATSLVLIFIVSNQSTASQRMSNHYVYYSLWATTYFLSQVL